MSKQFFTKRDWTEGRADDVSQELNRLMPEWKAYPENTGGGIICVSVQPDTPEKKSPYLVNFGDADTTFGGAIVHDDHDHTYDGAYIETGIKTEEASAKELAEAIVDGIRQHPAFFDFDSAPVMHFSITNINQTTGEREADTEDDNYSSLAELASNGFYEGDGYPETYPHKLIALKIGESIRFGGGAAPLCDITRVAPPTRDDFFKRIPTLEPEVSVNVSQSESWMDVNTLKNLPSDVCLLQIGEDGSYACAYLNDDSAKQLSDALLAYLNTPKGEPTPEAPLTILAAGVIIKKRDIQSVDYAKDFDAEKERTHGPNGEFVAIENNAGESVSMTLQEFEDFEFDNDIRIGVDVVADDVFEMLAQSVQDDAAYVSSLLEAYGLPVKPCGLNADWSVSAYHLSEGTPNTQSGDFYLLDDEITPDDYAHGTTYSLVQRFYNEQSEDPSNIFTLVNGKTAPECIRFFLAPLPVRPYDDAKAKAIVAMISQSTPEWECHHEYQACVSVNTKTPEQGDLSIWFGDANETFNATVSTDDGATLEPIETGLIADNASVTALANAIIVSVDKWLTQRKEALITEGLIGNDDDGTSPLPSDRELLIDALQNYDEYCQVNGYQKRRARAVKLIDALEDETSALYGLLSLSNA